MKKFEHGGTFTRTAKKCQDCVFRDDCDNKRMEACAYFSEPYVASAVMPSVAELVQPVAVKYDYRDVKVAENTTITIDVEKLKKKLSVDIFDCLSAV